MFWVIHVGLKIRRINIILGVMPFQNCYIITTFRKVIAIYFGEEKFILLMFETLFPLEFRLGRLAATFHIMRALSKNALA